MRTGDQTYLHSLGPYAAAMNRILGGTEEEREDKLTPGKDIKNSKYNLGLYEGCFIIFRGGSMKVEWIN